MVTRRHNRIVSGILAVCMAFTVMIGMSFTVMADENTGTMTDLWNSGSPTSAAAGSSYTIGSSDEFSYFVSYVNGGYNTNGVSFTVTATGATYSLTSVIAPATVAPNSSTSSPCISSGSGFQGTFDGGGNTFNLTISTSASGTGMFGYVAPTGTVKNFNVTGSVTVSGSKDAVGAVAGYNSGIIYRVNNSATVSAASAYNVGSIAGFNDGYYMTGHKGIISQCTNSGTVAGYQKVGGITGENSNIVSQCSNSATVTGSNISSKNGVGGIAGRNGNNNTAREAGYILNCCNTGAVGSTGQKWVGGIAGFNNSLSYVSTCYVDCTVTGGSYRNAIVGNHENKCSNNEFNYTLSGRTYTNSGSTDSEKGTSLSASNMEEKLNLYSRKFTSNDTSIWDLWDLVSGSCVLTKSADDYLLAGTIVVPESVDYSNAATTITLQNGAGTSWSSTAATITVDDPYLASALAAHSSGTSQVSIASTFTVSTAVREIFDSGVTFKWTGTSSGAMFAITAGGSLTMAGPTLDGNSTSGILVDVQAGTFKLRGGSVTQNVATSGYDVQVASGAAFKLSRATIGTMVNLASGAYIDLEYVLSSTLIVNSVSGSVVAKTKKESISNSAVTYMRRNGSTGTPSSAYNTDTNIYEISIN